MAIHISQHWGFVHLQPAAALVTFCTSGASVVWCSVLFAGDYKLQNFSPWLPAATRKHSSTTCTLSSWSHSWLCNDSLVNSIHTVVQSHVTCVPSCLGLCHVALFVVRWHLWCEMYWGIKTSLMPPNKQCFVCFWMQQLLAFFLLWMKIELPKLTT